MADVSGGAGSAAAGERRPLSPRVHALPGAGAPPHDSAASVRLPRELTIGAAHAFCHTVAAHVARGGRALILDGSDVARADAIGLSVLLQQVVANLIDNALKYTPADGTIRVVVDRDFDEAVIRVRDSGIGISPDVLPHVFDVFTQADQQTRSGLGLGLALVRVLVEQHGGRVTVRTAGIGHGTEFTVRLPLRPELVAAEPAAPPAHDERRRRILIIEDNVDARNTLRTLLEMAGHRVDVAGDGGEGVRQAIAFRPEVAIVDIGLPDMDGYEVARRLRAEVGSEIYLVALTGYGQPEDRRRAMESGFDAHLVKPIEPDRFLHVLKRGD